MPSHKQSVSKMMYIVLSFCILLINVPKVTTFVEDELDVTVDQVHNWAKKFGNEINIGSQRATCYEQINNNYNEMGAKPVNRDVPKVLEEMVTDIENMFHWKSEHVKRIAVKAEELAANYTFDSSLPFEYYNGKRVYLKGEEVWFNNLSKTEQLKYRKLETRPSAKYHNLQVNDDETTVHIPVNVWEEQPTLKKHIRWSSGLKDVFRNNVQQDPHIYWQYFCGSQGFMRLYPASKWRIPDFLKQPDNDRKPLDLYDCRLKNWFIKAAASPKDIVILLDGSGSMFGQRKEIARNVVINILDTLTDDDYVVVLRFSDVIEPVVQCFNGKLVEANPQNIMQIKSQLTALNTSDIANFTLALRSAFEILRGAKNKNSPDRPNENNTANCNQAIMLVTDGASENDRQDHSAIFEYYNWPNIDIRVFSYLIGKEVTEIKETNWIACKNRGYFTHVSNLAEIREQVQLYLPVMSRPLVLSRDRIIAFTGVYADVMDVPLNNWVWDAREREKIRQSPRRRTKKSTEINNIDKNNFEQAETEEQEEDGENTEDESVITKEEEPAVKSNKTIKVSKISNYQTNNLEVESSPKFRRWSPNNNNNNNNNNNYNQDDYTYNQDNRNSDDEGNDNDLDQSIMEPIEEPKKPKKRREPELMMTISAPVFDTKNYTNITEKFLEKNNWKKKQVERRSAILLGVAGVDVPIREITRLTPVYRLGVNGYSFMINNNGHVLFHPDLRPLFQELVKPFYSSIDLTEVEIENNNENPRGPSEFDKLRSNMINRKISWKTIIPVKVHLDKMKRVVTRNQKYWASAIKNTPFSLGVVVPESYGQLAVSGQIEFKRKDEDYKKYFVGDKWRVHPDWVYCDDDSTSKTEESGPRTPEKRIQMFLQKASQTNIRFKNPSLSPQVYEELTCHKELVQSLIFDAKATDVNLTSCGQPTDLSRYERDIADKFGINLTFVSTRSGFSRYEDHYSSSWSEYYYEMELEKKNNLSIIYQGESRYDPLNDSEDLDEEDEGLPFRDAHNKATDEVFYKRAVDFHLIDPQAFVFSVPFNAYRQPESMTRVTGSKAIFLELNNKKAPAAVVGLQIQLDQFANRFFNTTRKCSGKNCENICSRLKVNGTNCVLIDNNGYVVVSGEQDHLGRFFAEVDYNLFTTLLEMKVFNPIRMYDYQAICVELINKVSVGANSKTMNNLFVTFFNIQKFIFTLFLDLLVVMFDFLSNIRTADAYMQSNSEAEDLNYNPSMFKELVEDVKGKLLPPNRTRPYTCDKEFYLYEINQKTRQELLLKPIKKEYSKCEEPCHQNFIVSAVERTNLLLIVYKDVCTCDALKVKIVPKNIVYENECDIASHHKDRERVRLPHCNNYNANEEEIVEQCGLACSILPNFILIVLTSILFYLHKSSLVII